MKQISIIADNYKLDKFKKELDKKEYTFSTLPYTKETTAIIIMIEKEKFAKAKKEIEAICYTVESHFKRSN